MFMKLNIYKQIATVDTTQKIEKKLTKERQVKNLLKNTP